MRADFHKLWDDDLLRITFMEGREGNFLYLEFSEEMSVFTMPFVHYLILS